MSARTAILISGIYHIAFALFHLAFWRLFRWRRELFSLSHLNRSVMQILNLCLTFVFLAFAYLSFFHAPELLATSLGRALLLLVAVFWCLRAAEQLFFFGLRTPASVAFFAVFIAGALLYFYPWAVSVPGNGSEQATLRT